MVYGGALGTNEGTEIGSWYRKMFGATLGDMYELSIGTRYEKELGESVTGKQSL